MLIRSLLAGLVAWAAATAAFRFAGEHYFFGDGTWITWLTLLCGLAMIPLAYGVFRLLGVAPPDRPMAAAALAVPGMLLDGFVVSHFWLVFPNLDPDLDKAFGGFLLWCYAWLLMAGWILRHRP